MSIRKVAAIIAIVLAAAGAGSIPWHKADAVACCTGTGSGWH